MTREFCSVCRSGRLIAPDAPGGLMACTECIEQGRARFVSSPEVDQSYHERISDFPPSARERLVIDRDGHLRQRNEQQRRWQDNTPELG